MADKTPVQITSGSANRGSTVHASDKSLSDLSRSHTEEDISRLQSAFQVYSDLLTYKLGDVVVEAGVRYSNTTAILVPESFTPANWEAFASPSTPLEIESDAVLGLTGIQVISDAVLGEVVDFDENTVVGDASKVVDEGNGIFKLHNGRFKLDTELSVSMDGSGTGTFATFEWETSSTLGGTYTPVPHPAGRAGILNVGRANFSTQPHAIAFLDAQAADVFVRLRLTPDDGTKPASVLDITTTASIDSFGTSAVANTPLDTKGDLLTHNGTSEQRLPVGNDDEVVVADSTNPNGLKYIPRGYELLADVTLGAVGSTFDVSIPARTNLLVKMMLHPDTGTLNAEFNFNDDFGNNYAFRRTENMDYNAGTSDEVNADRVPLEPGTISDKVTVFLEIENQSGEETTFDANTTAVDGSVAVVPETQIIKGHWHDIAQVIKLNITTTINNFAANSRVLIYGSKD